MALVSSVIAWSLVRNEVKKVQPWSVLLLDCVRTKFLKNRSAGSKVEGGGGGHRHTQRDNFILMYFPHLCSKGG
jgi:hypothetical protein